MSQPSASERLAGLVAASLRALTQFEGTERALVLTVEPAEGPALRAMHGGLDTADLAGKDAPPGFTLHVCLADQKSIHSLDITQDSAFASCPRRSEGRSVLCVSVPGRAGPCGLLYADHPFKAGAFPHTDLRKLEAFASELGPQLQDALAAARAAPKPAPREEHNAALRLGAGLLVLAGLWAGTGVLWHTSTKPPPPPPAPTLSAAKPQVVAASYLSMLRLNQAQAAYELLSTRQKKRWVPKAYERGLSLWLKDSHNSWEIDRRSAGAATVVGRRADVVVQPAPGTRSWNYKLIQETDGGAWKLDSWDGGPPATESSPTN